ANAGVGGEVDAVEVSGADLDPRRLQDAEADLRRGRHRIDPRREQCEIRAVGVASDEDTPREAGEDERRLHRRAARPAYEADGRGRPSAHDAVEAACGDPG